MLYIFQINEQILTKSCTGNSRYLTNIRNYKLIGFLFRQLYRDIQTNKQTDRHKKFPRVHNKLQKRFGN